MLDLFDQLYKAIGTDRLNRQFQPDYVSGFVLVMKQSEECNSIQDLDLKIHKLYKRSLLKSDYTLLAIQDSIDVVESLQRRFSC